MLRFIDAPPDAAFESGATYPGGFFVF